MRAKFSFYLVLGTVAVVSLWLIFKLFQSPSEEKSESAGRIKTRDEKSSTSSSSKANEKEGLYKSIWSTGSGAKDRFGRDLKERAVVDNEIQNMRTLFEKGDLNQVKALLDNLLKAHPDTPEYVAMLGDYYLALDKYEAAEQTVRHLLELDPKNSFARETLARTLAVRGKIDEARQEVYEVLHNNPRQESAIEKLIVFASMQGQEEKGMNEVRQFINNNPKNGPAYSVLAEKFLERGETEQAFKWAQAGAKNDPLAPGNHRLLAVHNAVNGNMPNYLEHSRMWAQYENNPDYRAAAELNLLQALEQNGQGEEAYDVALRVDTMDPDLKAKADEIIQKAGSQNKKTPKR